MSTEEAELWQCHRERDQNRVRSPGNTEGAGFVLCGWGDCEE